MIKSIAVVIFLIVSSQTSPAEDRFISKWKASCSFNGLPFSLQFSSKSGDPTEDDQVVSLYWNTNKMQVLPIGTGLFVATRYDNEPRSYCDKVGAFDWPGNNILILLVQDDRPSEDCLKALIISKKDGHLLENLGDIGHFISPLKSRKILRVIKYGWFASGKMRLRCRDG